MRVSGWRLVPSTNVRRALFATKEAPAPAPARAAVVPSPAPFEYCRPDGT